MRSRQGLYVIVAGCGRLGVYVASKLSLEGHSVVAIDTDPSAFDALTPEYSGFRITGDATELAVLKQAKVDRADLVIAVTGNDNVNLLVTQVAREFFGAPRVVARLFDPRYASVYREMEIETVCPTVLAGDTLLRLLEGAGTPIH